MKNGELNRIPTPERHPAAEKKYLKAVALYANSSLPLQDISQITGVSADGLAAYIRRHHRDLIISRNNIESLPPDEKIKAPKGQSYITHLKYGEAIEACGNPDFIEFNLSEIARIFNLNPTGLSSQLKYHFPEILAERDAERKRLGLSGSKQRGAKSMSHEIYRHALKLYSDTDLTLVDIARQCNVSLGGFGQYLRFYHKDLIEKKALRRAELRANRNIKPLKPDKKYSEATAEKYKEVIESLKENPRAVAKAAKEFGFHPDILRMYLKEHHPELCASRSMKTVEGGRRISRAGEEKYMEAIREYAISKATMKEIAERRGLVYKSLMSFMKRNYPEAIESHNSL